MVTEEKLFAWLDGELDAEEAAEVQASVAADPRLSALAAEHRSMQERLKSAFDGLLDEPVPPSILSVANGTGAEIVDLASARNARRAPRQWGSMAQWGSIAATLVIGVLVGTALPHQQGGGPVEVRDGELYAAASLGHALDTALASAPAGAVRIGLTFRDPGGAICRSFTDAASSGLACRRNGRWQLRGLFGAPAGQSGEYRMAAGMNPALAALVDSTMAGEPLDAAQEKAELQRKWK